MTVLKSTDLLGGAIGASVTELTEPIVALRGGSNLTYADGFTVGGETFARSMQTTGSGDITIMLNSGQTHARVCFAVRRVAGTQTTSHYLCLFRDGANDRADAIIRNANGGNLAHRNNFTYFGQSGVVFGNGSEAWIEFEWLGGTGFRLMGWYEGNDTATPDFSYPAGGGYSAYTGTIDRVKVGNSGSVAGLTVQYAGIKITDGAQYRTGEVVDPPGTLNVAQVGWANPTGFNAVTKTTGADAVELVVSTSSDMSNPIVFPPIVPDSAGYSQLQASGLPSNTKFYWAARVDGVLDSTQRGEATTFPPPGIVPSFRAWGGSCHDWSGSAVFGLIKARNPLFGFQFGDRDYLYLTNGVNGPIAPADAATIRTHREVNLGVGNMGDFYRKIPNSYTYSDCDGAGANADGTWPGFQSGGVQAAYRQQFAHPPLPLANSQARSWTVGRWRFVHLDELTMSSDKNMTDGPGKTKLGAEQLAWWEAELLAAKAAGQVVIEIGDGPIYGTPLSTGTANSWRRYDNERAYRAAFIQDNDISLYRINGDDHTLVADDGSNNAWGGFPFVGAAPMSTTAHANGVAASNGTWPLSGPVNSSRQYGIFDFTDDGDFMTVVFHGYASTVAAPTEVERVTMTTTWDTRAHPPQVWNELMVNGQRVLSLHQDGELLWDRPAPVVVFSENFEGASHALTRQTAAVWTQEAGVGRNGSKALQKTDVITHHVAVTAAEFPAAEGRVFVGRVKLGTTGSSPRLAGLTIAARGNPSLGYQVLIDSRRAVGAASVSALQIRRDLSTAVVVGGALSGLHPYADTWYRIEIEFRPTAPQIVARVYVDATDEMIGQIKMTDAAYTTGSFGVYGYGSMFGDDLAIIDYSNPE